MAIEVINRGTSANDGTGDNIREAFRKVNDNFDQVLTNDTTDYTDATTPLAGTEIALVEQGGTFKKVAVSEFGGGGKKTITINKDFFTVMNPVDNWQYCLGSSNVSNYQRFYSNDIGSSLIGFAYNGAQSFVNAPFNMKLKRVDIVIYGANGGVYSLGIVKYLRANGDFFYSNTSINQAILLEEQLFDGATAGNQRTYRDSFTTEIADIQIDEKEEVIILFKSTTTTTNVPGSITLFFEEV
jgi:hypothetical protein